MIVVDRRVGVVEGLEVVLVDRREGRAQDVDDLGRALEVRVDRPEIQLRVAILLAGHLRLCDLVDEDAGALGHDPRVDLERLEPRPELGDVRPEAGGQLGRAIGRALREQEFLELVVAGEPGVVDAGLVVVLAGVDLGVEVGEQLGDRLDPLPRHARGAVGRLGRLEVPGIDGRGERVDDLDEVVGLGEDVGAVLGDCRVDGGLVDDRARWARLRGATGHRQGPARGGERAAHELVCAAIEPALEVDHEAREDVLGLVDDLLVGADDLELGGVGAGVGDHEQHLAGRGGDGLGRAALRTHRHRDRGAATLGRGRAGAGGEGDDEEAADGEPGARGHDGTPISWPGARGIAAIG